VNPENPGLAKELVPKGVTWIKMLWDASQIRRSIDEGAEITPIRTALHRLFIGMDG